MQPGNPADDPPRGDVPAGPAEAGLPAPGDGEPGAVGSAEQVVVGSRYRLLTRSGADEDTGAGRLSTWRARDNLLQRDVLLRIHAPGGRAARGLLDRSLAAGVLSHPALAMVYDAVDEDRRAYVVSEWVDGQSLAQALAGGPLPEAYARETIRRVAEGVAQAHQVGLPVGGLVPERIILTRSGSVTVAAIPAPAADFAEDVRALGALLFATMAGFLPITDDPVELDLQLTNASAPDLADTALAALDGRVGSAAELVAELVAHRRPGSLGETGGLSFITDRYEYDGPATDVWPTISGPRAQPPPAGQRETPANARAGAGAGADHRPDDTSGRHAVVGGSPIRLWAAALSAGRRARRRHPEGSPTAAAADGGPTAGSTAAENGTQPAAADAPLSGSGASDTRASGSDYSASGGPVGPSGAGGPEQAATASAPQGAAKAPEATAAIRVPAPPPPHTSGSREADPPASTARRPQSPPGPTGDTPAGTSRPAQPPARQGPPGEDTPQPASDSTAPERRKPGDTQPRKVAVGAPGGGVPAGRPGGGVPAGAPDADEPRSSGEDAGAHHGLFGSRRDAAEDEDSDSYDYDEEDPESRRRTWLVLAFPVAALLAVALIGWVLASSFRNVVGEPAAQTTSETVQTTTSSTPSPTPTPTTVQPGPIAVQSATVFDPFGDGEPENNDQSPLSFDGDAATAWPTLQYRGSPALGNLKPGVGLVFDLGAPMLVSEVSITTDQPGATVEIRAGSVPTGDDLDPFPLVGDGELEAETSIAVDSPEPARYWIVWITELVPDDESFSASLAEVSFTGVPAA